MTGGAGIMNVDFSISSLDVYKEGNKIEVKAAQGGLPKSLWETYSSFANTNGGVILLGVEEDKNKNLKVVGVNNIEKLKKEFWDIINNTNKVSVKVVKEEDFCTYNISGKTIIVIYINEATKKEKPVYINGDILGGTFLRNEEGDYKYEKPNIEENLEMERTTLSLSFIKKTGDKTGDKSRSWRNSYDKHF